MNKKIYFIIGFVSLISILGVLTIFNISAKNKIETELNKFIGYKAPDQTYLSGISVNFKPFECKGLFTFECKATDIRVHAKGTGLDQDILFAESIMINSKDIKFDSVTKQFKISLNKITPEEQLKKLIKATFEDKSIEKLNETIYNQLFPLDITLETNIINNKGTLNFSVNNKTLNLNAGALFEVNFLNEPFKIILNKDGKILKNKEEMTNLSAEYNTNQAYNTLIKEMSIDITNKELLDFLYNLYSLQMKVLDTGKRMNINAYFLDIKSDKILTIEDFRSQIAVIFSEAIIDMPLPLFQEVLKQIKESLVNKSNIKLNIVNKTNIKNEEVNIVLDLFNSNTIKQMEFTDENFEIKGK